MHCRFLFIVYALSCVNSRMHCKYSISVYFNYNQVPTNRMHCLFLTVSVLIQCVNLMMHCRFFIIFIGIILCQLICQTLDTFWGYFVSTQEDFLSIFWVNSRMHCKFLMFVYNRKYLSGISIVKWYFMILHSLSLQQLSSQQKYKVFLASRQKINCKSFL